MIPGGWIGLAIVAVVVIATLVIVADALADRRNKAHELQMAKLDHRQSLDETAIEAELADGDEADDDGDVPATVSPAVECNPVVDEFRRGGKVECIACGRRVPLDNHVMVTVGGYTVPVCTRRDCEDDAEVMLTGLEGPR